jgi:dTDP-4-dehydrorhamnose 3,5-epimerase-like enzyme
MIGIEWGIQDPILSPKDKSAPTLQQAMGLLPSY